MNLISRSHRRPGLPIFGSLLVVCFALQTQPIALADSPGTLFINPGSQDQNQQYTCPTSVVVRYNAIRYAYGQIVVVHNYTLPSNINPFGDVGQAAGGVKPVGANPVATSGSASTLVAQAITDVSRVENEVASLQTTASTYATRIQQLVVTADDVENLPSATPPPLNTPVSVPPASSNVVTTAHAIAQGIGTGSGLQWPTADIVKAIADVRSAQMASPSSAQSTLLSGLLSEMNSDLQRTTDSTDPLNKRISALLAWQPVLANIQETSFVLSHSEPCPSGAWADNAIVEFVGVDRTLVTSENLSGSVAQIAKQSPSANSGSTDSQNQNADSIFKKNLYTHVSPSRITATHGIGYSNIPQYGWTTGTTEVNGKNVDQVQSTQSSGGRPYLMTALIHYRLTDSPEPVALHATFAVTTSNQNLVSGMAGLSVSLHQSLYVTIGVFHDNVNSLNGYSTGQIIPPNAKVTQGTHGVNRFGAALSIPVFQTENGKSSSMPSTTPPPKTKSTPTPSPRE